MLLRRYRLLYFQTNPALRALLVGDALVLTAMAMLTPIYAAYVTGVGGDVFDAGLTAAALAFGSALASLVAGRYADKRKNKKSLLVLSYLVTCIGFLLFTTIHSVWYLAAVQLVLGLVRAFADPAYDALYSTNLDKNKEAAEWGSWEAMGYTAAGAGALIGGAIVAATSFNTLFLVMAALCAISALYMARVKAV